MAANSTLSSECWAKSNSSKLSLLPAIMKKIQSKMKALEWSQLLTSIFRRSRAVNSVVGGGVGPKFKLIQALMVGLVTCKNYEDQSKNELIRVLKLFLPLCLWDFFSHSRTCNSVDPGTI